MPDLQEPATATRATRAPSCMMLLECFRVAVPVRDRAAVSVPALGWPILEQMRLALARPVMGERCNIIRIMASPMVVARVVSINGVTVMVVITFHALASTQEPRDRVCVHLVTMALWYMSMARQAGANAVPLGCMLRLAMV